MPLGVRLTVWWHCRAQAGAQVKPEGARELERRVTFDLEGAARNSLLRGRRISFGSAAESPCKGVVRDAGSGA